jgi:uncharacterized membrane protein
VNVLAKRSSWLLALSLGLNLFLIAYGGARWLRRPEAHAARGAEMGRHEGREHRGHGLGPWLGPPTPELRAQHQALSAARHGVGAALSADPFDAEKLRSALATLRSTTSRGQELVHQKLVERASQMTASERAELAKGRFLRELSGPTGPR